ncbi:sodium-dependent bicarbonate transport family permease [Hyphobacterium sp.]|uniref:sodium-dependent bicarbonate transport family permease n=1 Tax=Hyphobacterium sp. TaxID=2004662 RepID=UPI003BA8E983
MDILANFAGSFLTQLQSPTLAFLIGGMLLAAFGSKLTIPDAIYKFIVFVLLMRIGLHGGMEIRDADLTALAFPALISAVIGCLCVLIGRYSLAFLPKIQFSDAIATAGLFGAVSASTLAAALIILEEQSVAYEAWAPALYPFMDIPALILAIVLATLHKRRANPESGGPVNVVQIIVESLRGSALSALILGLLIGILANPVRIYEEFYNPMFRGMLSILLLIMGMEAYSRLAELRHVAHWFGVYALLAPIVHGLVGFGLGYVAHVLFGFSPGGVILLAVMASSSSDISGPPTLRAAIPDANPSAYIGASTSIGTPVALAVGIPFFIALAEIVFQI